MKKIIITIITLTLVFMSSGMHVNAYENEEQSICSIKVTDDLTNEEIDIRITNENLNIVPITRMVNSDELEIEYDVTFGIPIDDNKIARDSDLTEHEEAFVRAVLKITYYMSNSNEEIKVTNVSGSWECTSSNIPMSFSSREVGVNDGIPLNMGNYFVKYPTTDSFSYNTGWGYVEYYPASMDAMSGARAYSEVTASIYGMGGSQTISASVAVP